MSADKKHRLIFDMKLQPGKLKESIGNLSAENISILKQKFPHEFKKIKIWAPHIDGHARDAGHHAMRRRRFAGGSILPISRKS